MKVETVKPGTKLQMIRFQIGEARAFNKIAVALSRHAADNLADEARWKRDIHMQEARALRRHLVTA